jgi:carboxyl-terminal processing protease
MALALFVLSGACGEGWRGGIHAQMAWSAERGLRVVSVPEGPARRAGLRVDDRIVAIDGTAVAGRPAAQVVGELRGAVGSRVRLTVERAGGADAGVRGTEDVEIERAPYATR